MRVKKAKIKRVRKEDREDSSKASRHSKASRRLEVSQLLSSNLISRSKYRNKKITTQV